jgi:hypothetical protein
MEIKGIDYAWIATVVGVVAWDIFADETMSSAMDRYLESKARHVAIGLVVLTGAHLLNIIPEQYDPFKLIPNIHSKKSNQ